MSDEERAEPVLDQPELNQPELNQPELNQPRLNQPAPDESGHDPFLDAGVEMELLNPTALVNRPSVLERLGPAHFRSKGFSFMGFLQTVYDHVAEQTRKNGQ